MIKIFSKMNFQQGGINRHLLLKQEKPHVKQEYPIIEINGVKDIIQMYDTIKENKSKKKAIKKVVSTLAVYWSDKRNKNFN